MIAGRTQPFRIRDRVFLEAYYRALRAELESKMLFGIRRKDKFDTGERKPDGDER